MQKNTIEDMKLRAIFAKNLKRFMAERELTQLELCETIGMNNVQISRWVNMKMPPSWDAVISLSNALEIPPYAFFRDEDDLEQSSRYQLLRKIRRFAKAINA